MKILVVEDEQKIARSLEKGLTGEGYIVDIAEEGDTAERLVKNGNYDLVILDWMIPGRYDGPGLIGVWRERGEQVPILMLTARTTIGDKVQGLDIGADDYLLKPFSYDELLARIRALLRRPKAHTGNIMVASQLELNSISKEVTYHKEIVNLTAKEFQLLEYLLHHKDEVLSKEQLLDHVWADEARVQHNTVETFVANLRKKIGPGEAVIKTVRGYGYKVS